ncbi:MAG TPA: tripartite tricarboxylate transporter substrate binding protein, partial [Burkholderiales bacterium]|nr:tripartite tricarboxylate transporter substrate binding protein [Burkholderiales bacterium]
MQHGKAIATLAGVIALTCLGTGTAAAQSFPDRPIRIIVPFAAGGPNDILARAVGKNLSEKLGQQVIADNRPGGGTVIGTEIAARAPADGYTLLMASTSHTVNPTLRRSLPFDTLRDFSHVILIAKAPNILVVHPSVPARSVRSLIALSRTKPGEVAYASGGNGTSTHLTGALLSSMAKVKMIHVPYKGGAPAVTALISGEVSWMFGTFLASIPHIRSGRMRVIATGGLKRSTVLPDAPTVAETLPGFESVGWYGVLAPAGTPQAVIAKLNAEINRGLKDLQPILLRDGAETIGGTPGEFAAHFRAEMAKWAALLKEIGLQP